MKAQWIRVSREKKCPICDHPDWCTTSPELNLALCMRVQSDRPSKNAMGGWIHQLDGSIKREYIPPPKPKVTASIDCQTIWKKWNDQTDETKLNDFARRLSVEPVALKFLGCSWAPEHRAWAFPMFDHSRKMVGIRLRNEHGQKWAVTGSHQGLFLPSAKPAGLVFICEGPTDVAAALSMGFFAIGRPSCMGCEDFILNFCSANRIHEVVIVTDNDEPGRRGAERLHRALTISSCIWITPVKDLREFFRLGGNGETMQSMIKTLVWKRPKPQQPAQYAKNH